jgi:hypothetical protein
LPEEIKRPLVFEGGKLSHCVQKEKERATWLRKRERDRERKIERED